MHACASRRSRHDVTNKQLRYAAALLQEAAGVSFDPVLIPEPANETVQNVHDMGLLTRHHPGLDINDDGHVGALKELVAAYDAGGGSLSPFIMSWHPLPGSYMPMIHANDLFCEIYDSLPDICWYFFRGTSCRGQQGLHPVGMLRTLGI